MWYGSASLPNGEVQPPQARRSNGQNSEDLAREAVCWNAVLGGTETGSASLESGEKKL